MLLPSRCTGRFEVFRVGFRLIKLPSFSQEVHRERSVERRRLCDLPAAREGRNTDCFGSQRLCVSDVRLVVRQQERQWIGCSNELDSCVWPRRLGAAPLFRGCSMLMTTSNLPSANCRSSLTEYGARSRAILLFPYPSLQTILQPRVHKSRTTKRSATGSSEFFANISSAQSAAFRL